MQVWIHWFKTQDGGEELVDESQFMVREWRLEKLLGVSHLCLPPDYRVGKQSGQVNKALTIPFLRFQNIIRAGLAAL